MFDKDNWQEIFETIKRNKLRTFLTAFSVAWGIFILVVLLASGTGLRNGAESQFANDAANSIWVNGGTTSLAYQGYKPGREIKLTNDDYKLIRRTVTDITTASAVYEGRGSRMLSYKKEHVGYMVRPVMPDHQYLEKINLLSGRFINELDMQEFRKVCCLGKPVCDNLFKGEEAVGKYIDVEGAEFKVIGVFKDPADSDNDRIYIPLSTAQKAWNGKDRIHTLWIGNGNTPVERTSAMADEIRNVIAKKYGFNPQDPSAMNVFDNNVEYQRIMSMLTGINIFVKVIAILTLLAGIVGVSNIMMIVVKERTREIGIRKAIGATPGSIISQILMESIFITSSAGYIGLLLGVLVVEAVKGIGINSDFFKNPDVDFGVAIFATILLVLSGALAGLIPSIRASRIQPVEALRAD